ncbi:hypothetical protein GNI_157020 [Gregarina niphandrodes]|uniref:Uncharacterized protein n=1 Tax=Gregarina niphandrodes TaxID=110365 RepID=A0A023AYW0_GRENI|nr:hypothetical protein GNI_157020 [Gregarina niphandrodes]EZG43862.1 hypothetical protein GNI_157020 [Gregarina niphandrodes]|eukprot:XP_011132950.1 hypothetical protein GNI_157020 [Gregarina niphandrodes]
MSCEHVDIVKSERKLLATACVSLSWKQWEDREGVQNNQKLRELCKAYYLLNAHYSDWRRPSRGPPDRGASETEQRRGEADLECHLQDLATTWLAVDEGQEMDRLRERLKTYELLVLRSVYFCIETPDYIIPMIAKTLRTLVPGIASDPYQYDGLYQCALGIFMDYLRWPNYLHYDFKHLCTAIAFKAAVTMHVSLCNHVDQLSDAQLTLVNHAQVREILQDIRTTYGWAEAAEAQTVHTSGICT